VTAGATGRIRTAALSIGPCAALLVASVAFRWPALINASTVDSDAAIVGLQAMHILRGEWAWLLFGSGYQTSVDSAVAAGFFVVLGPTPLALVLSTLVGHMVATLLAFATLARHLPRWTAALVSLPLVFTPTPLHTYILGPPRQASLTLVFLALWLIDGCRVSMAGQGAQTPSTRAPRASNAWAFGGGLVASIACFADPYALLFLPPLLLLGLFVARDSPSGIDHAPAEPEACRPALAGTPTEGWGLRRQGRSRFVMTPLGALVGIVPLVWLLSRANSAHGEATFTASVIGHNFRLLEDECLPWVLSVTAYVPTVEAVYVPWRSGMFRIVQVLGAALLLLAMTLGGLRWAAARSAPLRDLGRFGNLILLLTLAAFLVSPMVMDLFSSRYLSAIILMCPFALAPAAARLGAKRFGALLAPYLVSAMACGWLGFGERVKGLVPVHLPGGGASDEERLGDLLQGRGVHHAIADYWVSYRLTFLYKEAIEVVPIHPREDRYAPYRQAESRATLVAYIFDARRSREKFAPTLEEIASSWTCGTLKEIVEVGDLIAVIGERP
jgi:hypothetical protein